MAYQQLTKGEMERSLRSNRSLELPHEEKLGGAVWTEEVVQGRRSGEGGG